MGSRREKRKWGKDGRRLNLGGEVSVPGPGGEPRTPMDGPTIRPLLNPAVSASVRV